MTLARHALASMVGGRRTGGGSESKIPHARLELRAAVGPVVDEGAMGLFSWSELIRCAGGPPLGARVRGIQEFFSSFRAHTALARATARHVARDQQQ